MGTLYLTVSKANDTFKMKIGVWLKVSCMYLCIVISYYSNTC